MICFTCGIYLVSKDFFKRFLPLYITKLRLKSENTSNLSNHYIFCAKVYLTDLGVWDFIRFCQEWSDLLYEIIRLNISSYRRVQRASFYKHAPLWVSCGQSAYLQISNIQESSAKKLGHPICCSCTSDCTTLCPRFCWTRLAEVKGKGSDFDTLDSWLAAKGPECGTVPRSCQCQPQVELGRMQPT